MGEVHLLLDWQQGLLGCDTRDITPSAVPLSLAWKITCETCRERTLAGPRKGKPPVLSHPPQGEAVLLTGLVPLVGGRGQKMNALEAAYYAVLNQDGTVLRTLFEPFPLPLGKSMVFWVDFVLIRCDASLEFHEVKSRKRSKSEKILARYIGDGRAKWKMFCEKYHHLGACKVAIGWRDQGAYRWEVREEKA